MNRIIITADSSYTKDQIDKLLESIFWDGSHFEELENVDWTIE
jgi:fructose/tagatose bisphosphate aldolase